MPRQITEFSEIDILVRAAEIVEAGGAKEGCGRGRYCPGCAMAQAKDEFDELGYTSDAAVTLAALYGGSDVRLTKRKASNRLRGAAAHLSGPDTKEQA